MENLRPFNDCFNDLQVCAKLSGDSAGRLHAHDLPKDATPSHLIDCSVTAYVAFLASMLLPRVRLFRLTPLRLVLCAWSILSRAKAACLKAQGIERTSSCLSKVGSYRDGCRQTYPQLMSMSRWVGLHWLFQRAWLSFLLLRTALQLPLASCALPGWPLYELLALAVEVAWCGA